MVARRIAKAPPLPFIRARHFHRHFSPFPTLPKINANAPL
jgi:hypothetical protein